MSSVVVSAAPVVWRLAHLNGQTARCIILPSGKRYRVQRWLNEFVSGADEFDSQDAASRRADDIRRDFERRGFREDF